MALAVWAAPAQAAPGDTTLVSVSSAGEQGNDASGTGGVSISGDGGVVAFTSNAFNLVEGDSPGTPDVFVREAGATRPIGGNASPSISADGRVVAFEAGGVVGVHDRDTGATVPVGVGFDPALSADGRHVAFHAVTDSAALPARTDVFVHDRETGVTEQVSLSARGGQPDQGSTNAAISADGRFVAFESAATNLVDGDTNAAHDVFVRDTVNNVTQRVSVTSAGGQAGGGSSHDPAISADGRYVAFASSARNLVPFDTLGIANVYVRDTVEPQTRLVSVPVSDLPRGASRSPSISADGRFVAFHSDASNLVDSDTNSSTDVFVRDTVDGQTERASVHSDGTQANNLSAYQAISADGRFVAFASLASNLVEDGNGTYDVFVHELALAAPPPDTTPPQLTVPGDITVDATGPGGAIVTFSATANDDTDPEPTVTCDPPSGSAFPIGATTVTCTATDDTGNQAVATFTVSVQAPDPEEVLSASADELDAIVVASPGTPLADKVEDAFAKVQAALDELGRTPPDQQAAAGNIEGAVGELEAAVKDGLLDAAAGAATMGDLAAIARQLAADAIAGAQAAGGDADDIAQAEQSLAEGDGRLGAGGFKDAVNSYKDALSKARSALQQ